MEFRFKIELKHEHLQKWMHSGVMSESIEFVLNERTEYKRSLP